MGDPNRVDLNLKLYSKVYLIRKAEELIVENYKDNGMKTPMHMSMGHEAISPGVCEALGPAGLVVGYYRSHALFLAKTGNAEKFFGEMYGKANGAANGKAGSMHLSSPEDGFLCASAIVAGTISVGVGVAYANKIRKGNAVVASFFGDGAMDGGVFWESLNFACLKKIPMIFVCEDNDLAIQIPSLDRQGYQSMLNVVRGYNCHVMDLVSADAEEIFSLTREAIHLISTTGQPCFMRLSCYRYLEHVGVNEDFDRGYRSREGFNKWLNLIGDPVMLLRKKLTEELGVPENQLISLEVGIDSNLRKAIDAAKASKFPSRSELYKGVFYGE